MDPVSEPGTQVPESIPQSADLSSAQGKSFPKASGILWVLLVVFFGSLVYLGYQNWQLKQEISQAKVPVVPTISITPSTDSTANWKTIHVIPDPTFELVDYEIKIPESWVQIEHSSNFQNTETFQDAYVDNIYQLIINQEKNINPRTRKSYSTLRELTGLNYETETVVVAGQTAAKVLPRAGSETNFKILFIAPSGKQIVSIELITPRDGEKVDEGQLFFDQILSTFKFTDSNKSTSWKTYINEEFGFSLSYPPEAKTTSRDPDPFPVAIQIQDLIPRTGGANVSPIDGWLIIISETQLNPGNLSLRKWAQENKLIFNENVTMGYQTEPIDMTIGGLPTISWSTTAGDASLKYYLIKRNSGVTLIIINPSDLKEPINQIISTFKFTN